MAVRRCVMRLVPFPVRPCKESGIYRFLPYHYSLCCLLCGAFVVLIARIVAGNSTHTQLLLHFTKVGGTPILQKHCHFSTATATVTAKRQTLSEKLDCNCRPFGVNCARFKYFNYPARGSFALHSFSHLRKRKCLAQTSLM